MIVRIISSQLHLSGDLRPGDRGLLSRKTAVSLPCVEANTLKGGDDW